ncbi:N-acetylneuraminate synthase family protein [Flavobacteriaceae bacterium]|nr:N-acetylneuraminate synthase family protein [Flavobacteriaceae bacterium]MDB9901546.1 N-acetylneuraminate synthase family protein [Flavobacteriaceae bacterium]MDC0958377.1 N-acetylneuraminate synthase family protein [Flavobacteriaceae bacterium]
MKKNEIFNNLFVLELANNHWGDVERGIQMIEEFSQIVRFNNIKAAIKLQFREIDSFVHPDYVGTKDNKYIEKTTAKKLSKKEYKILIDKIKDVGCIPMSTPFDEKSVDLCVEFDLPIIKVASSDINDWPLLEKIATTKKPVILSSGGSSLNDMDNVVKFFTSRDIPMALNHCVSVYPSEDFELELNQIDFLKNRYPDIVIGQSTHEYNDWTSSIMIAYAKGARTFERHIDTTYPGYNWKKYNSNSEQIHVWFQSFKKAVEMCGGSSNQKRRVTKKETDYLDVMVRGVYAKKKIKKGHIVTNDDFNEYFYLAVPLHKGQLSCREIKNGEKFLVDVDKDKKIMIDQIDSPYSKIESLKKIIYTRGV